MSIHFSHVLYLLVLLGSLQASPSEYLTAYFQNAKVFECTELKGGLSGAKNYRVQVEEQDYVLRILNPQESKEARELEIQAAQYAGERNIGPRIFYVDPLFRAMIMEFIDGETLNASLLNDQKRVAELLQTIKSLHTSQGKFPRGSPIFEKISRQLEKLKISDIPAPFKAIEEAQKKLSQIEKEFQDEALVPCHNDLSALNVLAKKDSFKIIDWTDCGLGHAYNDLGYFVLVNSIDASRHKEILHSYLQRMPSEEEIRLLRLMIQVNKLRIFASNFPAYEPVCTQFQEKKKRQIELENMLNSQSLQPLSYFFELHRQGKLIGKDTVIALSLSALKAFLEKDVSYMSTKFDTQTEKFLDAFSQMVASSKDLPLPEARKISASFFMPPKDTLEPVGAIVDEKVVVGSTSVPIRLYIPESSQKPFPVLLFFHPGGWVFGGIDQAEAFCRKLARRAEIVVVSVGYSLAPENPFPQALLEGYAVLEWMARNAEKYSANPHQIAVGGASAGGNLAAALCLMAKDKGKGMPILQLLLYPPLAYAMDEKRYSENPGERFLPFGTMKMFWDLYLPKSEDRTNPYAVPLEAKNLQNLCPSLIVTTEFDPLRDDAEAYAKRLEQAGNRVVFRSYKGLLHGFLELPYEQQGGDEAFEEIASELKRGFNKIGT